MVDLAKKEAKGYLIDIETSDRLEFQFNPKSITDTKSSEFAITNIHGRSLPQYQFLSGGSRIISFDLELFGEKIKDKVEWLRKLQIPKQNAQGLQNASHRILLSFGELYESLQCVLKNVSVSYHTLFESETLNPKAATISLSLEEQG